MPNRIEYRGFTASYSEPVSELITPISILPILAAGRESRSSPVEVQALWDTGATVTCMKPTLFERLKLRPLDTTNSEVFVGVGGEVTANLTLVNLLLAPNFEIEFCPIYVLVFPGDTDLLIGMDIIRMGDFAVCNAENKTSFSFAVPPFPDRINLADKAAAANRLNNETTS